MTLAVDAAKSDLVELDGLLAAWRRLLQLDRCSSEYFNLFSNENVEWTQNRFIALPAK